MSRVVLERRNTISLDTTVGHPAGFCKCALLLHVCGFRHSRIAMNTQLGCNKLEMIENSQNNFEIHSLSANICLGRLQRTMTKLLIPQILTALHTVQLSTQLYEKTYTTSM